MFFSWPHCCYRQVWWEQSAFERWPSTKPRLESQTGRHWKAKDNFQFAVRIRRFHRLRMSRFSCFFHGPCYSFHPPFEFDMSNSKLWKYVSFNEAMRMLQGIWTNAKTYAWQPGTLRPDLIICVWGKQMEEFMGGNVQCSSWPSLVTRQYTFRITSSSFSVNDWVFLNWLSCFF